MSEIIWAQAGGAAGGSSVLVQLVPFALIIAIFYFLMLRPQIKRQREHQAMVEALSKGDQVVTQGGLFGTIVGTKNDVVTLKIAENTKVEVQRSAISAVRGKTNDA